MKNILVAGKKVDDVAGLYYELIKNQFEVENVGVDQSGTHVFLHDSEQKDPAPLVDGWLGKGAPTPTKSMIEQRKTMNAEYQVKRAKREAEDRAKAIAESGESQNPVSIATPVPVVSGSKETLFSKIFRKLW